MTQLDSAGLVPDDLKPIVATGGVNSWGGNVTLDPAVAGGGVAASAGFTIGMTGIPQTACTQLVNRVAPSFLTIGNTAKGAEVKDTTTNKINLTALATACGTDASAATLYFTAR